MFDIVAIFLQNKLLLIFTKKNISQIIIKSISLSIQYIVLLLLFIYLYSGKQQFTGMNAHLETSSLSIHFSPSSCPKLFLSSLRNVTPTPWRMRGSLGTIYAVITARWCLVILQTLRYFEYSGWKPLTELACG